MKCPRCNNEVNPNAKFCDNCGMALQQQITTPTAQPIAPQAAQTPPANSLNPQNKEPWYMNKKMLFSFIGIIVVVLIIVGSAVSKNSSSSSSNSISSYSDDNNTYENYNKNVEEYTPVSFKKGQIYKGHKCKISVTDGKNDTIKFYIENNSKKDYAFNVHSCAINGEMTDCNKYTMRTEVPAGKKANAKLDLSKWIDSEDINVEYVDILFWVYGDMMKQYDTGILRIKTDAFNKEVTSFDEGSPKIKKNNLSVSYLGKEDNILYFSLVNKNKYMIDFNLNSCSVNGWAFDTGIQVYGVEVYPKTQEYFTIELDEDFVEDNSIKKIKNIEFKLEVSPDGDIFNEFTTKKFKFNIK